MSPFTSHVAALHTLIAPLQVEGATGSHSPATSPNFELADLPIMHGSIMHESKLSRVSTSSRCLVHQRLAATFRPARCSAAATLDAQTAAQPVGKEIELAPHVMVNSCTGRVSSWDVGCTTHDADVCRSEIPVPLSCLFPYRWAMQQLKR